MSPGPSKQFDRKEVLERAMEVFWDRGFEGASLSELLERMEIGRQSLYDTFGDKHRLFLEALALYMETLMAPMLETLGRPAPAAENLRDLFQYWREHASEGDCRGCLLANTTAEFGSEDPEIQALIERGMRTFEVRLQETLARAKEEGSIPARVDSRQLASTFLTLCQGLAVLSRSGYGADYVAAVTSTMGSLLELDS